MWWTEAYWRKNRLAGRARPLVARLVEQASDQHQAEEMNAEDPRLFSTPLVLPGSRKACCTLPRLSGVRGADL